MMRSARRRVRKCVAQWRPPCPHGKRGQQNAMHVDTEGRGVVWISKCPDNTVAGSAMERSPQTTFVGFRSMALHRKTRLMWDDYSRGFPRQIV
eukprot:357654-Chlamydomonas_euryale.AAC.1